MNQRALLDSAKQPECILDQETTDHLRRVYRAHRRRESWTRDRSDFAAEAILASLAALLAWFADSQDGRAALVRPLLAALGALALWEFAVRPFRHYLWTVPEAAHLRKLEELRELRAAHEAERARLNSKLDVCGRSINGLLDEGKRIAAETKQKIDALQARDLGIDLSVREMEFRWGSEDIDGVMVVVGIERLANGNTTDAALEISLKAPLLMTGSFTFELGIQPEPEPVPYIRARVPLLSSPINIPAKSNLGRCYMLFNFRRSDAAPYPFGDLWKNRSADEVAKALEDSEMYFEIRDVVNATPKQVVLAPGTAEKQRRRLTAPRQSGAQ